MKINIDEERFGPWALITGARRRIGEVFAGGWTVGDQRSARGQNGARLLGELRRAIWRV